MPISDQKKDFLEQYIDEFGNTLLDPELPKNHPYNALNQLGISAIQVALAFSSLFSGQTFINGATNELINRRKENALNGKNSPMDILIEDI